MLKICPVLFALLFAACFPITLKAQRLKEDKIDEFTKAHVIQTKWCAFTKNKRNQSVFRITKIDSTLWLDLQIEASKHHYVINQGDPLMFLFDDGSTVKVFSEKNDFARGGAPRKGKDKQKYQSSLTTYRIGKSAKDSLLTGTIVKFRVYWSNGYMEEPDEYRVDKSIKKCINLVQ